jgi:hypothetical protein
MGVKPKNKKQNERQKKPKLQGWPATPVNLGFPIFKK